MRGCYRAKHAVSIEALKYEAISIMWTDILMRHFTCSLPLFKTDAVDRPPLIFVWFPHPQTKSFCCCRKHTSSYEASWRLSDEIIDAFGPTGAQGKEGADATFIFMWRGLMRVPGKEVQAAI